MKSRSNVWLWVLYDFANSIVSIVFFLYFAQWVVIDRGLPDFWFNLAFTASAVLLLFTVPLTGVLLDSCLRRLDGLRMTTVATAVLYGFCALAAVDGNTRIALVLFTLGLYSYLLSFSCYTPLLRDIAEPSKRGKVSGLGIMANYLGQFTGLLIVLPFSNGSFSLFGGAARAETLLPAVVVFFVLSLPMLIFFREPAHAQPLSAAIREAKNTFRETARLFAQPNMAFFFASYFLFNDAILTASNNFPIYLEQVWGISDTVKTYVLLGILVTSAIGGLVSGTLADRFGHKRMLQFILSGWVVIFPLLAVLQYFPLFIAVSVVMGFWFGSNWAVSRSVMAYLAPQEKHNVAFAYFGLVERASSFVGPIVWSLIVANGISLGPDRYRIAVAAMAGFVVLGLLALSRVRSDKEAIFV